MVWLTECKGSLKEGGQGGREGRASKAICRLEAVVVVLEVKVHPFLCTWGIQSIEAFCGSYSDVALVVSFLSRKEYFLRGNSLEKINQLSSYMN